MERFSIESIGNYYGGLNIAKYQDKYYWVIENHDSDLDDIKEYNEISEALYLELKKLV